LAAAMAVYCALGPVPLDRTRKACLEYELPRRGISAHPHDPIPIGDDARERASCWLATQRE
jgi:hypothetical protein